MSEGPFRQSTFCASCHSAVFLIFSADGEAYGFLLSLTCLSNFRISLVLLYDESVYCYMDIIGMLI